MAIVGFGSLFLLQLREHTPITLELYHQIVSPSGSLKRIDVSFLLAPHQTILIVLRACWVYCFALSSGNVKRYPWR